MNKPAQDKPWITDTQARLKKLSCISLAKCKKSMSDCLSDSNCLHTALKSHQQITLTESAVATPAVIAFLTCGSSRCFGPRSPATSCGKSMRKETSAPSESPSTPTSGRSMATYAQRVEGKRKKDLFATTAQVERKSQTHNSAKQDQTNLNFRFEHDESWKTTSAQTTTFFDKTWIRNFD